MDPELDFPLASSTSFSPSLPILIKNIFIFFNANRTVREAKEIPYLTVEQ